MRALPAFLIFDPPPTHPSLVIQSPLATPACRERCDRPQVCGNQLCAGEQIESAVGSTAVSNCEGAA